MPKRICLILAVILLASPALAAEETRKNLPYQGDNAAGWKAVVTDYSHAPSFMIAVDKKDQQVSIFERQSPFTKVAEFTCTTGQKEGDKLVEGDLKTPEGVYFVVKHINRGLDYTLYGYEAYPLNYPNPVDRLRKKTGYGIWIHGKGVPIVPYDSNGCVGLDNNDIASLKQKPMIGQPVTMALDIIHQDKPDPQKAATSAQLAQKVEAWAKAWSSRSAEMFDFYDAQSYSLAQGQSFAAFKAQKEHLFKALPWIKTSVSDIQVLEGPGYWVTWFNQNYEAPNLKSFGTRRLYWQQGADGELRIVGMEWLKDLKSPVLYAENKAGATLSDAGSVSGQAPEAQAQTTMESATAADKTEPQPAARPENQADHAAKAEDPALTVALADLPVTQPELKPGENTPDAPQNASITAQGLRPNHDKTAMLEGGALEFVEAWQESWKRQDLSAYAWFYADDARQDSRRGLQTILSQKNDVWGKSKVTRLDLTQVSVDSTESGLTVVMRQDYSDSRGYADKGIKTLYLENHDGWRIVREDWKPALGN